MITVENMRESIIEIEKNNIGTELNLMFALYNIDDPVLKFMIDNDAISDVASVTVNLRSGEYDPEGVSIICSDGFEEVDLFESLRDGSFNDSYTIIGRSFYESEWETMTQVYKTILSVIYEMFERGYYTITYKLGNKFN